MEKVRTPNRKLQQKRQGIHYTPARLAHFLAQQISNAATNLYCETNSITILDPACGDGQLLAALLSIITKHYQHPICVVGFDTDRSAIDSATKSLESILAGFKPNRPTGSIKFEFRNEDFLSHVLNHPADVHADIVISNPPYVRTQVMGQDRSVDLAKKFGLSGRVDLYHAFNTAIANVLNPGGILGLLTPNRFMSVQSGATMRQLLVDRYEIRTIFDLGDTRLFKAAVLPMVLIGEKRATNSNVESTQNCRFVRIYQQPDSNGRQAIDHPGDSVEHVLDILEGPTAGSQTINLAGQTYLIERGRLAESKNGKEPWRLVTDSSRRFAKTINSHQRFMIEDLAEVKVGIKTTADKILIRDEWSSHGIEEDLVHPLITHVDAKQWRINNIRKQVLYPYQLDCLARTAIDLKNYPAASRYLESHRATLSGRRYLIDSGREWFEIWVPQKPHLWKEPKVVWPDISENPRFFLDRSGAIVNGDCYWLRLRSNQDPDWLYLILGVANSSFTNEYYDTFFHNKLYAGRRRFMTQYVKKFPLPDLESPKGAEIVARVKRILTTETEHERRRLEGQVNQIVWESLGFKA